jgi:hypothetical protein
MYWWYRYDQEINNKNELRELIEGMSSEDLVTIAVSTSRDGLDEWSVGS